MTDNALTALHLHQLLIQYPENSWELSASKYKPDSIESDLNYYISNSTSIIATPSNELTGNQLLLTTAPPLEKTLDSFKNEAEWRKALIPICQSNKYFFGLLTRRHFTLLKLSKDDKGNISAHHIDSKGWLSWFYPLSPIKNYLKKVFKDKYDNKKFSCSYLGHQGLLDNVNCGRFVASYINNFINGGIIGKINPQKDPKIFESFDQKLEIKQNTANHSQNNETKSSSNLNQKNKNSNNHVDKILSSKSPSNQEQLGK